MMRVSLLTRVERDKDLHDELTKRWKGVQGSIKELKMVDDPEADAKIAGLIARTHELLSKAAESAAPEPELPLPKDGPSKT